MCYGQRLLLLSVRVLVVSTTPNGVPIAFGAMSNAYLAVAVFVVATLFLVLVAERGLKTDFGAWLDCYRTFQVRISSLLGAMPGCGGAIIVVTQYTRGCLSFCSVAATFTATMGDAMFLLLAQESHTALFVLGVSMAAGVICGYLINLIHGPDFLRSSNSSTWHRRMPDRSRRRNIPWRLAATAWFLLMAPGIVLGILLAVLRSCSRHCICRADFLSQRSLATPYPMMATHYFPRLRLPQKQHWSQPSKEVFQR